MSRFLLRKPQYSSVLTLSPLMLTSYAACKGRLTCSQPSALCVYRAATGPRVRGVAIGLLAAIGVAPTRWLLLPLACALRPNWWRGAAIGLYARDGALRPISPRAALVCEALNECCNCFSSFLSCLIM